jgi:hypothetical protein
VAAAVIGDTRDIARFPGDSDGEPLFDLGPAE